MSWLLTAYGRMIDYVSYRKEAIDMRFLLIAFYLIVGSYFFIMGKATTPPEVRNPLLAALAALLWPISIIVVVFYVSIMKFKTKNWLKSKYTDPIHL